MQKSERGAIPARLLMATEEIRAILEKHDLAGLVVIHCHEAGGQPFIQHLEVLGPSYSCVEFNGQRLMERELPPPMISADPAADPDLPRKRMVADTINMLSNIRAKAMQVVGVLAVAEAGLRQRYLPPPPGHKNGKDEGPKGGIVL